MVVDGCLWSLRVVCGRLLVGCGRLPSFVGVCWWFVVACGRLWLLSVSGTLTFQLFFRTDELIIRIL